jgi:hypothetical protein
MLLSAALASVLLDDLAKRRWLEVKIPLDRKSSAAADLLHFGKREVAPFFLMADDVAKKQKFAVIV